MSRSIQEVTEKFNELANMVPFIASGITDDNYQDALDFLESLMVAIGDNPDDGRWLLFNMVADAVEKYEYTTCPGLADWDRQDGAVALLKVIMRQHGLRQSDLPEIGSQGVVSEILRGKRTLNLNQILALSERFRLPAEFFLPSSGTKH